MNNPYKIRDIGLATLLVLTLVSCSSARRVSLAVPHKTQKPNLCVPASASMVLAYYGHEVSQDSLKALAGYRKDFDGTYFVDMIAGLEKIGYHWVAKGFDLDHAGFEAGMTEIKRSLADGRPVLVSTSKGEIGHTMVIVGYNEAAKTVELMDPAGAGMRTLQYDTLEDIWHDDFQSKDRWILDTWPRK